MRGGRNWTQEERDFLRDCALADIQAERIAPLVDRSVAAVRMMRHKLGIAPPGGRLHHMTPAHTAISVAEIKGVVARHFHLPVRVMDSPSRDRSVARPRQVAMFFAREVAHKSFPKIGFLFGGRDHSTVIHGHRTVERLCGEDDAFAEVISTLRDEIGTYPRFSDRQEHFPAFAQEPASA